MQKTFKLWPRSLWIFKEDLKNEEKDSQCRYLEEEQCLEVRYRGKCYTITRNEIEKLGAASAVRWFLLTANRAG